MQKQTRAGRSAHGMAEERRDRLLLTPSKFPRAAVGRARAAESRTRRGCHLGAPGGDQRPEGFSYSASISGWVSPVALTRQAWRYASRPTEPIRPHLERELPVP